jgi:hypothetical protein
VAQRVHAGAVGGVHRVERLDGERHFRLPRIIQHRGDTVLDLIARLGDVL